MQVGLGVIKWSPAVYWASTPVELMAAVEGHVDAQKALFGVRDLEVDDKTAARLMQLSDSMPDAITVKGRDDG